MTNPFGLGSLHSPPDPRDWPISALYAMSGASPVDAASIPASYLAPDPYPPVLNQGDSPKCVAYGSAGLKGYQDLRDTGPVVFDEDRFFTAIGGTVNGAVPRDAFAYMLATGYPEAGGANAAKHKIAAYYAVPVDQVSIQSAILTFGVVGISIAWPNSWFHPVAGVLPTPGALAGGHFIGKVRGWDARGLRMINSWGTAYGVSGEIWMPWAYLGQVKEVWKAQDHLEPMPATSFRIHLEPHAQILAVATFGPLKGTPPLPSIATWQKPIYWGPKASGAPCGAISVRRGASSGSAPIVFVPKPAAVEVAGKWIRVGTGVSVIAS